MTVSERERLTAEEAQARGMVPAGMVWDETTQAPIARGDAIVSAALERPVDLQRNLEAWRQNRETLVRFIGQYLQEADYNEQRYPISGQMHDYYRLPNYDKKALTKQGAEKIAQLFRFARASTETVQREATKGGALAVVRVVLVDHYRRPVGSGEAACSTAEKSFQGRSAAKYGGDYRAALNDVIARAGKRAFVQAVIYVVAGDELFESAASTGDDRDDEEVQREAATTVSAPRFPKNWKEVGGKLVSEVSDAQLQKVADWCRKARMPEAVAPLLAAVEAEQESRRQGSEAGPLG